MAFWIILWKAIKFRLKLSRLKRAKKNAYRQSLGLPPQYPLYERPFRWTRSLLKKLIWNTCCACLTRKRSKSGLTLCDQIWMKGTLPNRIALFLVGLTVGTISSILLHHFLLAQLSFNPAYVSTLTIIFGVILTIGLAISDTIRCLFILGIPQFFSNKGRAAVLAYVLILAVSGPGKNTAHNMEILTESLVCGQDMVKNSTRELVALATEPYSVLKNAMSVIITSVKDTLVRMNHELKAVINSISEIIGTIKSAFKMLQNVVNMCNSKLGTPYDRCMVSFNEASEQCEEKLGSAMSWMCKVVDVFQNFCHFAKVVDLFCWLPSLVKEFILDPLKEQFQAFTDGFKTFFDVRLNFTYKFDHKLTQDKTLSDIGRNMKTEIMEQVQWLLDYFDWIDCSLSLFFLTVVWKAVSYRMNFLSSDSHDNYYITKGMIRMELDRQRVGREVIFPLRYRESKLYVQPFSWDMVDEERKERRLAMAFVLLASVQILSYVAIDYLLFLFLELVRTHGAIQIDTKDALGMVVNVEGEGFLAEMYRSILDGLSPVGGVLPSFDTSKCLPYARKPDYHEYTWICFLLILSFAVAIMEPYGLRLRHIVCCWVYPDKIIPRERWLYVHILTSRGSFLTFARRFIHAKVKGDASVFRVSLMDRLAHTVPCLSRLFVSHKKNCFLCGRAGQEEDFEHFITCPNDNCKTVYCKECFEDMQSKCTACLQPIDYGDLTDASEELGSGDDNSDSESDFFFNCCPRKAKNKTGKLKTESSQTHKNQNNMRNRSTNRSGSTKSSRKSKPNLKKPQKAKSNPASQTSTRSTMKHPATGQPKIKKPPQNRSKKGYVPLPTTPPDNASQKVKNSSAKSTQGTTKVPKSKSIELPKIFSQSTQGIFGVSSSSFKGKYKRLF